MNKYKIIQQTWNFDTSMDVLEKFIERTELELNMTFHSFSMNQTGQYKIFYYIFKIKENI